MRAGAVVVGTGQAGFEAAASLRSEGYQERVNAEREARRGTLWR